MNDQKNVIFLFKSWLEHHGTRCTTAMLSRMSRICTWQILKVSRRCVFCTNKALLGNNVECGPIGRHDTLPAGAKVSIWPSLFQLIQLSSVLVRFSSISPLMSYSTFWCSKPIKSPNEQVKSSNDLKLNGVK